MKRVLYAVVLNFFLLFAISCSQENPVKAIPTEFDFVFAKQFHRAADLQDEPFLSKPAPSQRVVNLRNVANYDVEVWLYINYESHEEFYDSSWPEQYTSYTSFDYLANEGWLQAKDPLGTPILLPSNVEKEFLFFFNPDDMFHGHYEARAVFDMFRNNQEYEFVDVEVIPFKLELEAPADPLQSRLNISNCLELTIAETCSISVEIRDKDGFAASHIQSQDIISEIRPPMGSEISPRKMRIIEGEIGTDQSRVELEIFAHHVGKFFPLLALSQVRVPMHGKEKSIDIRCGWNSFLDSQSGTCKCEKGYYDPETPGLCERCPACTPGNYFQEGNECKCEICEIGFFCPDQFTRKPCPRGSFCPGATVEPKLCPVNTFQPNEGAGICELCNDFQPGSMTAGAEGALDSSFCTICPERANCDISQKYAESQESGTCPNGQGFDELSYPSAGKGILATSSGNAIELRYVAYPEPGFFRFPSLDETTRGDPAHPCASIQFLECPGGSIACKGEANASLRACSDAFDGFLCAACAPGYALSGTECASCRSTAPYVLAGIAAATVFSLTAFMSWSIIKKGMQRRRLTSATHQNELIPSDTVVTILKIAYSHMQVVALLLTIDVDWHQSVDLIEKLTSTLTVSGSEITSSVMCLFGQDYSEVPAFYKKVIIVYAFPLLFSSLFGIGWVIAGCFKACAFSSWKENLYGWQVCTMILLFLLHIVLTRTALELFVCTDDVQDRSFLVADPRLECFRKGHTGWFVVAGFGGLLVYGAGIPSLSALLVLKGKNDYLRIFLCRNFRERFRYWESVVALRKVLITIFVITLDRFGPNAQGISCLMVLFFAFILQLEAHPYSFPFLNQLETCGILTAILTLSLAMYSLSFEEDVDYNLNVLIAFINLVFIVFIVYELVILSCICFSSSTPKAAGDDNGDELNGRNNLRSSFAKSRRRSRLDGRKEKRKAAEVLENKNCGENQVIQDDQEDAQKVLTNV